MRPRTGDVTVLVYRECPCGDWCATGEGAMAPKCVGCGGYFLPAPGDSSREGMERRWRDGRGFVALFTAEMGAVEVVARLRRWLGLVPLNERGRREYTAAALEHMDGRVDRYYQEAAIRAQSDDIVKAEGEPRPDGDPS